MKYFYGVETNKSASALPLTANNFLNMKKGLYLNTFKFSNQKGKRAGSRMRNMRSNVAKTGDNASERAPAAQDHELTDLRLQQ